MACGIQSLSSTLPSLPQRLAKTSSLTPFLPLIFAFTDVESLRTCAEVCKIWGREAESVLSSQCHILTWNKACQTVRLAPPLREMDSASPPNGCNTRSLNDVRSIFDPTVLVVRLVSDHSSLVPGYLPPMEKDLKVTSDKHISGAFSSGLKIPFDRRHIPCERTLLRLTDEARAPILAPFGYELRSPLEILERRIRILDASMARLHTQLKDEATCLCELEGIRGALEHKSPSDGILHFHSRCLLLWKEVEMFEEVVSRVLLEEASQHPASLAHHDTGHMGGVHGIRSFVHVELLTVDEPGSVLDLMWRNVKSAIPADDSYYNYVDFLFKWGHGWAQHQLYEETWQLHEGSADALDLLLDRQYGTLRSVMRRILERREEKGKNLTYTELCENLASMM